MPRRSSGFTLIEMMIAIAILGILSAVATPLFRHHLVRSKQAEIKMMLGAIRTAQESFLASRDHYAYVAVPHPAGPPGLKKRDWQPAPSCAAACKTVPAACTSFDCIGFKPSSTVYASYVSPARPPSASVAPEYAIGAISDLDGDGHVGSWSYQSASVGGAGVLHDGISACPLGIPPGLVMNCTPFFF